MGLTDILIKVNRGADREGIKYFLAFPIYKIQEYGIPGRDLVFEDKSKRLGFRLAQAGVRMPDVTSDKGMSCRIRGRNGNGG